MTKKIWQVTGLTAMEKYVLSYILNSTHANSIGYYYLPIGYISCDTGIDEKEVRKIITALEKKDFISYDAKTSVVAIVNFYQYESTYYDHQSVLQMAAEVPASHAFFTFFDWYKDNLNEDEMTDFTEQRYVKQCFATTTEDVKEASNEEVSENHSENDTETKTSSNDASKSDDASESQDDFEILWKMYPKKYGKISARNAYEARIKKGELTFEKAKEAVENYVLQCKKNKTDKQYILNGSNFFGHELKYMDFLNGSDTMEEMLAENLEKKELEDKKNALSDKFNEFWNNYPKQLGREVAEKEFIEIVLSGEHTAEELIVAAKNYADYCNRKNIETKYILQANTFLDNEKKKYCDYLVSQYNIVDDSFNVEEADVEDAEPELDTEGYDPIPNDGYSEVESASYVEPPEEDDDGEYYIDEDADIDF